MKKISELYNIDNDTVVKDIKINSKEVNDGDIFVCTMGVNADRHDYVKEAVKNGAKLIVVSKDVDASGVEVVKVEDTNKELINLCKKVYDFDENLDLIAITGTNGKTTTAELIRLLLGSNCGYIGTNGVKSKSIDMKIRNTTPDADRLYKYFNMMVEDGADKIVMETSSEAYYRHRLDGLNFKIGVITNITRDHLNIHKTIENYVDSKMDLVRKTTGVVILNHDDEYYLKARKEAKCKAISYGKDKDSDLVIEDIKEFSDKTLVKFSYNNKTYEFKTNYLGEFNVYNIVAAILVCLEYNSNIEDILKKIENLESIEGRFQSLEFGQNYKIILDYAHTLDAFSKILPFLNRVKKGRLVVVTGAAGGRDKDKRAGIGEYLLNNCDEVVFTMDDPRYEEVKDIIKDLIGDAKKKNYIVIEERTLAIRSALKNAKEDDIILIAGKGNDNYMAIEDKYIPYSDMEVINKYFGGE